MGFSFYYIKLIQHNSQNLTSKFEFGKNINLNKTRKKNMHMNRENNIHYVMPYLTDNFTI